LINALKFQKLVGVPQEQFLLEEAPQEEVAGINMHVLVFLKQEVAV
jgi:hypothetical protein